MSDFDKNVLLVFLKEFYLCGGLITAYLKFEIRDIWIGIYWNVAQNIFDDSRMILEVYICLVPMFPIIIKYFPFDKGAANSGQSKN